MWCFANSLDEQKKLVHFSSSPDFFFTYTKCLLFDVFLCVGMTTRLNKARYAELKQNESEETQLRGSLQNKRCHLKTGGGGDLEKSFVPSAVEKAPKIPSSSSIVSIEELTPPFRSLKGRDKGKLVSDFWDNPSLVVAMAHDVISTNELKRFLSIELPNLVTQHLHKNVQVCFLKQLFSCLYCLS